MSDLRDAFEWRIKELELRIMEDVVRRIKKAGKITSSADHQLNIYRTLGNSTYKIEQEIKKRLAAEDPEIWRMYDEALEKQYIRDRDLYEQMNEEYVPWDERPGNRQVFESFVKQSQGELKNFTRSLGFAIKEGNKTVFKPLSVYYQKHLDNAILDITTGAFDYNSVLRRVVKEMTTSGIRVVDYASGHSNRIEVAARRAVMTGISQVTGNINEQNAQILGTNWFEVDWHAGARPSHKEWQGKPYTYEQLISICGLHTVTGLGGTNCYHGYYPFFPGISKRNYTDEWLVEQNRKEEQTTSYKGKEYTPYQASQRQRHMETAMRAQRDKIHLLKQGEAAADTIVDEQIKYQNQLYEYTKFSNVMGLKQQRERIYMDRKGRVLPYGNSVVKYQKIRYNKDGSIKITDDWSRKDHVKIPSRYRQNAVVETTEEKSGVKYRNRTIYDQNGHMVKQIHSGNHGNPKIHNYGKNGEHVHIYEWEGGRIKKRYTRELREKERKEHKDLWKKQT